MFTSFGNFIVRTCALWVMLVPLVSLAAEPAGVEFKAYTQRIPGTDVTFEMVPIPGGRFVMGSPADESGRDADEGPRVEVIVEPFWMGKHEVTWGEYQPFLDAFETAVVGGEGWVLPKQKAWADAVSLPTPPYELLREVYEVQGPGPMRRRPAVGMTQQAARQYTKWLSKKTGHFYRLPTEAEWEYASRAGATTAWHFGDDAAKLGEFAWYWDNSNDQIHPVGQKKPNPWGLHDMYGNAAEWVMDAHSPDGYTLRDRQPVRAAEAIVWPTELYPRVVRGGSYFDNARDTRSAARLASDAEWHNQDPTLPTSFWWETEVFMGLRVVRPLHPPPPREMNRFWEDLEWVRDYLHDTQGERHKRVLITPAGKQGSQ